MNAIIITADRIANAVADYVDQRPAIDPCDIAGGIIDRPVIEIMPNGRIDIIDGYHRLAGIVRWCQEQGAELASTTIECVTGDECELAFVCATCERDAM